MSTTHYLSTPLTDDEIKKLKIGDLVYLSGTVYTARDAAHKRLINLIEKGQNLPFEISGSVIYYVGPSPTPPGKVIGAAGPTTSYRMDSYTVPLLNRGLKAMIGKGNRSTDVIKAMQTNKAVYLAAVGGAALVVSQSIIECQIIAYSELGAEAIRRLVCKDFPCIVAIDSRGNDLYKSGRVQYQC